MTRFVDLSHPIEDGMEVYMGFPPPQVSALISREESRERYRGQAEFLIGKIDMPLNVGTYLDSPFHRFERGTDVAGVPLERLAGLPGVVVDGTSGGVRAIPPDVLAGRDLAGRAVLFRTGWDSRWGTDGYAVDPPFLPRDTVEGLVSAGVTLVGVDFPNVDDTTDLSRPAHTELLQASIPIVEHLCNLGALPAEGFRFTAVPAPVVGAASFPVRAFAELT